MDIQEQLREFKAQHDAAVKAYEEQLAVLVSDYEESIRQMEEQINNPIDAPTAVRMTAPTGEEIVVLNLAAFDQIATTFDLMADVVNEMQKTM